ncbi:MAG TPA: group I intron-associated PD-(D/E)XK endonuclease [Terriglobales bacterium]|nr:group I intron-associated PD-(D/E)XK endonuclease [Terriglobales bacterium]
MIRNDEEYAEVLRQLQELFAERRREAGLRRVSGGSASRDKEGGISISAAADNRERKRDRNIGRGIRKRNTKAEGEMAELAYMYMAGKNGIRSAKPYGDSLPFDQIAITPEIYDLYKVQVRCTAHHKNLIYAVSLMKAGGTTHYQPHEFDYLAALLVPEDAWYIIPFAELPATNEVYLHPRLQPGQAGGRCDKFRSRWDLLRTARRS